MTPAACRIGQRPEQRCQDRDGLAVSQLPPDTQNVSQAATGELIDDQGEGAVSQGDGTVLTDHMLAVDSHKHGHLLIRLHLRPGHVTHRNDLKNDRVIVEAAHRNPRRAGRARAQLAPDDETRHERLLRDGSPYSFDIDFRRSNDPGNVRRLPGPRPGALSR